MRREDFMLYGEVMPLPDDFSILGLFGPYRCLSNFHQFDFEFNGLVYHTPEAAYMAQKTMDIGERELFTTYTTGPQAKEAGRKVKLRDGWDTMRIYVMQSVVMERFMQDEASRAVLLSTWPKYIEETNWWKDRFWGIYDGEGENHLGRILMTTREFLARWAP